jgi:hypothetical protein
MDKYKQDVMFDLRNRLWWEFTNENIFIESDYYSDNLGKTIVPIFPVQQVPELHQFLSGKKHIIYDKISTKIDQDFWNYRDQIMFTVYATDFAELLEIQNLIIDFFRRYDQSAYDIMYISPAGYGSSGDEYIHSTSVVDISPIGPSEELQGFLEAQVIIEVFYSRASMQNGRRA